jgi:hypothetical protein
MDFTDSKMFEEEWSLSKKYFIVLYHAVLMIGNNEMGP